MKVRNLSFCMESVKVFMSETDIKDKKVSDRSSYVAEINSLVTLLQNNIGRTWNHIVRAKITVKFGDNSVNNQEYPWIVAQKAVDEFPDYFNNSKKIFEIDPLFSTQQGEDDPLN